MNPGLRISGGVTTRGWRACLLAISLARTAPLWILHGATEKQEALVSERTCLRPQYSSKTSPECSGNAMYNAAYMAFPLHFANGCPTSKT